MAIAMGTGMGVAETVAKTEEKIDKRRKITDCVLVLLITILLCTKAVGCIGIGWLEENERNNFIHDAFINFKSLDELIRLGKEASSNKNYERALKYYAKSAEKGHVNGQVHLGYYYFNGYGVRQDLKKAVEWYTKAAENGHTEGQASLGYCYFNGYGVKQDLKKAVEWYTKAADKGHVTSMYMLGKCYERGNGVPQDSLKAKEWYEKAKRLGYK